MTRGLASNNIAAWRIIRCSCCNRNYRCTLSDDYYNSTTLEGGVCEKCALEAAGMSQSESARLYVNAGKLEGWKGQIIK